MLALLLGAPVGAEVVSIQGAAGTAGSSGADGDPGAPGSAGGDAPLAEALADAAGEDNSASATGGTGGRGGDGGNGVPAGADAGDGGPGGDGGDSLARAIGTDANAVSATAIGGRAGFGGSGGSAASPGSSGQRGAEGVAGDALAEAFLATDRAGPTSASAMAFNDGLESDATARARVVNAGTGAVDVQAIVGLGSRADSVPRGVAEAFGSNAGSDAVHVRARVESGLAAFFGSGFEGGDLQASAEGHSSGGGDVTVEAFVGRGNNFTSAVPGDLVLHDAVRGSTTGRLTLRQTVDFLFFGAGDAITSLAATNPGGGDLGIQVLAGGASLGDVVLGDVVATSDTGADVAVDVSAASGRLGGEIFQETRADDGSVTPSRIHGASNGGDVDVSVRFSVGQTEGAFDGLPLDLADVATADTTGALSLTQEARGGAGGVDFFGTGNAGSGGSARSSLSKHAVSSSLALRSIARGGRGAQSSDAPGLAGVALAVVEGSNTAGSVQVGGLALGADGAIGNGDGGAAAVEARAETSGDGQSIVVGEEALPASFYRVGRGSAAVGGAGGGRSFLAPASGGDGGDASSESTGVAHGDASVEVFDVALGGRGASGTFRGVAPGVGGDGGLSTSFADARGNGSSRVAAKAHAIGGAGGGNVSTPGRGGDADARAAAEGLGRVESWALAVGGDSDGGSSGQPGSAGAARARASAQGTDGFARAEASTGVGVDPRLRALSEVAASAYSDAAAVATHGAALSDAPSGHHGVAFFTGRPQQPDVDAALAGNAALAAAFANEPGAEILALGVWSGAGGSTGAPSAFSSELELELNDGDPARRLMLAAFGVEVLGDAFESLAFAIERDGVAFGATRHFDSAAAATAFFEDWLLDLGPGLAAGDSVRLLFELVLDTRDREGDTTRFAMGIAAMTMVPEPGTAPLLVFGLIWLARRARR